MNQPERVPPAPLDDPTPDPTVARRRRHGSRHRSHRSRSGPARKRLRTTYFVLASFWGFLIGTGAILWTVPAVGRPISIGGSRSGLLVAAGVLAVIGGVVAARAYHEASKRLGR